MRFEDLSSPVAESGIIATLIKNPQFLYQIEGLEARDFTDANNASILWAISELAADGVTSIDAFQLAAQLSSAKAKEARVREISTRDLQSIVDLSECACRSTVEEFVSLVRELKDYRAKRELYIGAQKLQNACLSSMTADDLQTMLYSLTDAHSTLSSRNKPIEMFGQIADHLWQEQQDRISGKLATVPMHIDILNNYTELESGELVIVGGPAKIGKSAFLLSATVSILRRNMCVLVVDSELSDRLYLLRLIAHVAQVPFQIVKNGNGTGEQKERIEEARAWIKKQKLYHIYVPAFDEAELLATFRRVNVQQKVDVLVLDYLKTTAAGDAFDVSYNLGNLANTVKNRIAGDYGIPVLSAVQTTDNGAVALSKGIQRYTSTLFTMRRKTPKEIEADGGPAFGNTYIFCPFNRNGRQMNSDEERISLQFDGDILTYRQADKQPVYQQPY
jgi:replicative DNA helicase